MPVDLILLSGFLGSGKTTLLVEFLRHEGAGDTGVIVNEAGEIGVDGAIVAESDVPMLELANGCVCCSLRSSLVHTVSALLDAPRAGDRPPLRRIVLETSGLSRPGPIIASLADPELAARDLRVSVVSTYDCETGLAHTEQFEEAAAQLAAAQRIVLTKLDRVRPDSIAMHRDAAAGINPFAEIIAEPDRTRAVARALACAPQAGDATGAARFPIDDSVSAAALPHPRIHVMKGEARSAMQWPELALWLDDLAGFCGERLLRFKAIVHVTDCADPILIQSVGTTFGAPRPLRSYGADRDVFVVITRDIDAEEINTLCAGGPVRLVNQLRRPPREQPGLLSRLVATHAA
ncbi:GTP-binding protein [Ramlibacter ginsenosidimutans]|uniref:GTP-binding protein n=1 Tax=Ramlibacter ginsenosidimutans TaxID=502333 RepID=A0A934TPB8_9BURK|nr:GTP-binding protein [Ramlibacter ginsenosidimutans]MBK6004755.1 GTP-binding protein [Ramlibacter ginsenosidimutans]